MHKGKPGVLAFFLSAACLLGQPAGQPLWLIHQSPDESGVYYVGPEVTAPRLLRVMPVAIPPMIRKKAHKE
jgi:hypothetical protein